MGTGRYKSIQSRGGSIHTTLPPADHDRSKEIGETSFFTHLSWSTKSLFPTTGKKTDP